MDGTTPPSESRTPVGRRLLGHHWLYLPIVVLQVLIGVLTAILINKWGRIELVAGSPQIGGLQIWADLLVGSVLLTATLIWIASGSPTYAPTVRSSDVGRWVVWKIAPPAAMLLTIAFVNAPASLIPVAYREDVILGATVVSLIFTTFQSLLWPLPLTLKRDEAGQPTHLSRADRRLRWNRLQDRVGVAGFILACVLIAGLMIARR